MKKRREEELVARLTELRNSETFSLLSATEMVKQIAAFLEHGLINEAIAKQRRLPPPLDAEQALVYAQLRSDIATHFAKHGHYGGVLDVLQPYDTVPSRVRLPINERALISLQLAEAYSANLNYPSAVTLLNESIKCSTQSGEKALEAKAQCQLGFVYFNLGEYVISQEHLKIALKIFTKLLDKVSEAQVQLYLGNVLLELGEFDKSIESNERAIKISKEIKSGAIQTQATIQIGNIWLRQGKARQAISFYDSALQKCEERKISRLVMQSYNNLAYSLIIIGNWIRAESLLEKNLVLARQNQDDYNEAFSLILFGLLYTLTGRFNEAKPTLSFALDLTRQIHAKDLESLTEVNLGKLYLSTEEKVLTLTHLKLGLDMALAINRFDHAIEAELTFVSLCLEENKLEAAKTGLEEANEWVKKQKNFLLEGKTLFLEAKLAFQEGQEFLTKLNQAYEVFEAFSCPLEKAVCLLEKGQMVNAQNGATEKILTNLIRAQELFQELGAKPLLEKTDLLIKKIFPKVDKSLKEINLLQSNLVQDRKQIVELLKTFNALDTFLKEITVFLQNQTQADLVAIYEINPLDKSAKQFISTRELNLLTEMLGRRLQNALSEKQKGWINGRELDEPLYLETLSPVQGRSFIVLFWGISTKLFQENFLQSSINFVNEVIGLLSTQTPAQIDQTETKAEVNEMEAARLKNFKNLPDLLYTSRKMTELTEQITRIHSSDLTVLITGESGTGKDLVARAIHAVSERRNRAFSPFNCTATPQEIVEAQLFGYRKGAFTGANIDYEGIIRAVEGGTLLLDEIGDLRLDIQPKLLRFLQDGEIQPVGYSRPIKVNVRIIASTNRDLEKMVEKGEFREDLYHRLNILRLFVPPLRQRREEILPLALHFLKTSCERTNKQLSFNSEVIRLFGAYDWPGNIRQLKNEIERIVAFADEGGIIAKSQLSQEIIQIAGKLKVNKQIVEDTKDIQIQTGATLDEVLMQTEKQIIQKYLKQCRGNIRQTAALLGISRKGLYDKIKRLKIRYS